MYLTKDCKKTKTLKCGRDGEGRNETHKEYITEYNIIKYVQPIET